ncbi:MAG: hypothetical protein ACLR1L_10680 [Subdoligranulum sp.]
MENKIPKDKSHLSPPFRFLPQIIPYRRVKANALHTGSGFEDTAKILRVKNKSMCTRPPRKPKIFDSFCHAHAFVLSDDTLRFMPGGTGAPEIQPVFYKHSRIFAVQLV